MILSAITLCTNPLTTNYLTYIAYLNSWAKYVDEIIIVDGGTTDKSYSSSLISELAKQKMQLIE